MAPGKITNNTKRGETNRQASNTYYGTNAFEIQARRLYNDISSGKRKKITQHTITKYNLQFDTDGNIIVPQAYLPSAIITVEPTEPQDLTVKAPDEVHLIPKVMFKGPVTTKQIQEYIKSPLFNEDRKNNGAKQLTPNSITQYTTGAGILIKLGLVGSKTEDIMPVISDPARVIAAIQSRDVTQSTINKDVHSCYNLCKNIPMVRDQVSKTITQEYGKLLGEGKKENTNTKYDELQSKPVYKWPDVVNNVDARFGLGSLESLYFHVYQEVPIRGELKNLRINPDTHDGNFIIVTNKSADIHLKKYKTDSSYGDRVYSLSPSLVKMVIASIKKEPRLVLFPIKGPLTHWLGSTLREAGYPNFPYGPSTTPDDKTKLHLGVRHTFAAYANSNLNRGQFPSGHKLASVMLHELQQSLTAYTNKQFLENEPATQRAEARTESSRQRAPRAPRAGQGAPRAEEEPAAQRTLRNRSIFV